MNKQSFVALLATILLSGRGLASLNFSEEEVYQAVETVKKILVQTEADEELN